MARLPRSLRPTDPAHAWGLINLVLAVVWALMIPVAILTGWLYSLAFISACSIYANAASHVAGWRADR